MKKYQYVSLEPERSELIQYLKGITDLRDRIEVFAGKENDITDSYGPKLREISDTLIEFMVEIGHMVGYSIQSDISENEEVKI